MTNPNEAEQNSCESNADWQRKHYQVQKWIAIGGGLGLIVLIMQWCQMRTALQTDQRAWVTVSSAKLLKPLAVSEEPLVEITIANSGKSPARNVKILGVVAPAAETPDKGSVDFGDARNYPSAVLGPGAPPIPVTVTRPPLGETEELAIRSNANALYVWGEIRYADIFDRNQTTGFCFSIRQKDIKPEGGSVMTACETGNWAK